MNNDKKPTIGIIGTGASVFDALAAMHGKSLTSAPINDKITTPPTLKGQYGQAWKLDLSTTKNKREHATLAMWLIEAPNAHPAWHSYLIAMVHLRPMNGYETKFYKKDATHELWVFALNPDKNRQDIIDCVDNGSKQLLMPRNYGGQFIEITDELAIERIENTVKEIVEGKLSPDTDYMSEWIKRYGNDMIKDEFK